MTEEFYSDVRRGAGLARRRRRVKFVFNDMNDKPHYPSDYADRDFAAQNEINAQSVVNSHIGVSSNEDTLRYAADHNPRRYAGHHPQYEPQNQKHSLFFILIILPVLIFIVVPVLIILLPILIPIYILIQIGKSSKRK
ncbi:MAG: hypothetical protein OXG09_10140 [Chloroflexi bacterium]|nr:hypothetical protein [Chloroflexota bacterium]